MSAAIPSGFLTIFGQARGVTMSVGGMTLGVCRLPTDPIGTHTLTLTNVVVGSRIAIRDQANTTTFYDQTAAASTVVVSSLPVYSAGSPLNDLSIRVRKASAAPKYQPFETFQTIGVGSSSVFIAQVPDSIAS